MRPPELHLPLRPALTGVVALTTAASVGVIGVANACFEPIPDDQAFLSLELAPGVSANFTVRYFAPRDPENPDDQGYCSAGVDMPLSAFPSIGSRLGTDAVAAAIQEATHAMEIENCSVWVWYVNDVGADFTNQELCVGATYGFSGGSRWSIESESYCWEEAEAIEVAAEPEPLDWEEEAYAEEELIASVG